MTKTFQLKGHFSNADTVIVVIEGRTILNEQMPQEEFLGTELATALYNILPSGTLDAVVAELKELRENWSE